jgi:hypothetical protein
MSTWRPGPHELFAGQERVVGERAYAAREQPADEWKGARIGELPDPVTAGQAEHDDPRAVERPNGIGHRVEGESTWLSFSCRAIATSSSSGARSRRKCG